MRQLQFLCAALLLCILSGIINLSCRKIDLATRTSEGLTVYEKFFTNHRSSSADEKKLVSFLKRKNEEQPFIETTVSRIGFPIWDKTIRLTAKTSNHYITVTSETGQKQKPLSVADGSDLYYIPFARDSQNHVNAAMVIKASLSDTSIGYLCDWQYRQLLTAGDNSGNKAGKFALFFMRFDNAVFGHTRFRVTDKALFPTKDHSLPEQVFVTFKTNLEQPAVKVNLYDFTCRDYQVDFNYCPWIRSGIDCKGPGGSCDHCKDCPHFANIYTECWTEWVDDSWNNGSPGGGGSGGGGSSPPPDPCNGGNPPPSDLNAAKPANQSGLRVGLAGAAPCGPGWEPDDPNPIPNAPVDTLQGTPCATAAKAALKMSMLFDSSNAASKLATIPNLATEPLEKGFIIMESIRINPFNAQDTISYGYSTSNIFTGTTTFVSGSISYNPNTAAEAAFFHTHPPTGYAAQSAKDVYNLIEARLESKSRRQGGFVGAANGSNYAIAITDLAQAEAFFNTKSQYLDSADWKKGSDIGKAFVNATDYFRDLYKNDSNMKNLAYEMAMAAVLNQFNTGITLCKQDATGKFKPLVVRTQIQRNNRGKVIKTVYIQDCN